MHVVKNVISVIKFGQTFVVLNSKILLHIYVLAVFEDFLPQCLISVN